MKLLFFCPRWGSELLNWTDFCKKVKAAGYDGIEAGVSFDAADKLVMQNALNETGLLLIGQYWQSFESNFEEHQLSYKNHLENMATLNPVKINTQTGKDYFLAAQNEALFTIAANFTAATGIEVVHETHRNKALFAAHIAKQYLERNNALRITADFSHWCCVAESFLEDQEDAMQLAMQHTAHIHSRVGHTEGPQVTDPRLPEGKEALAHHLNWWKQIIAMQKQKGTNNFSITTEFGPAPYMTHDPISKLPLANQWEINVWMMEYLKQQLSN